MASIGHSPGLHFISSACFQLEVASALPKAGLDFVRVAEFKLCQDPILKLGVVVVLEVLANWEAAVGGRKMVNSRAAWTAQWDAVLKKNVSSTYAWENTPVMPALKHLRKKKSQVQGQLLKRVKILFKKMERTPTLAPQGHGITACDHTVETYFFCHTANIVEG